MEPKSRLDGEDAQDPHLTRFVVVQRDREETLNTDEHSYIIVKVARNEDLAELIGKIIYFDLVDFDIVKQFHVPKQSSFNLFKVIFREI